MKSILSLILWSIVMAPLSHAELAPNEKAPPSFHVGARKVVAIDMTSQDLKLTFDVKKQKVTGHSVIKFQALERGYPMLDLVQKPTALKLDGKDLIVSEFKEIKTPDGESTVRVIPEAIDDLAAHTLEIEYQTDRADVTFQDTGVRYGWFMSDLDSSGRGFLEHYAPSNFEYDSFIMTAILEVVGSKKKEKLYTNGTVIDAKTDSDTLSFVVKFPEYFRSSSFYLHLSNKNFFLESAKYQGIEKEIPIEIYSDTNIGISTALKTAKETLKELEKDYGPYAHPKLLIYLTSEINGGMEYCGATMSSNWALDHEITHSYFARGVMPNDGNAGWIDEAIASWRDNEYKRETRPPGSTSNMGGFGDYRRHTPSAAYSQGRDLMGHIDYLMRNMGGLKSLLKTMYEARKLSVVDVKTFEKSVATLVGEDQIGKLFNKYVFGKGRSEIDTQKSATGIIKHRPYSFSEHWKYR